MSAYQLRPVLVVDDNEDDLFLIERLLAKAGVKNPIITFQDATEVIEFLQKAASEGCDHDALPCILLTDLKMPRTNGFELVEWVREQKLYAEMPIVMISSSAEKKDLRDAEAVGVNMYFVKLPTAEAIGKIILDASEEGMSRKVPEFHEPQS